MQIRTPRRTSSSARAAPPAAKRTLLTFQISTDPIMNFRIFRMHRRTLAMAALIVLGSASAWAQGQGRGGGGGGGGGGQGGGGFVGGAGGGGGNAQGNRTYQNTTMVGDAMITSDVDTRRL